MKSFGTQPSELNLFGRFYVTATDKAGDTLKYQYHFIQRDKVQNLIMQQDGTNQNNNHQVESHDLAFAFLTDEGILPQLTKTTPFNSNGYAIEYNDNSLAIAQLSKTIFKNENEQLYQFATSLCEASSNIYWKCNHWDSYLDTNRNEENRIDGNETEKVQLLTPDGDKLLNNPLQTRAELVRLSDRLFN